jgi:hypothetical protein
MGGRNREQEEANRLNRDALELQRRQQTTADRRSGVSEAYVNQLRDTRGTRLAGSELLARIGLEDVQALRDPAARTALLERRNPGATRMRGEGNALLDRLRDDPRGTVAERNPGAALLANQGTSMLGRLSTNAGAESLVGERNPFAADTRRRSQQFFANEARGGDVRNVLGGQIEAMTRFGRNAEASRRMNRQVGNRAFSSGADQNYLAQLDSLGRERDSRARYDTIGDLYTRARDTASQEGMGSEAALENTRRFLEGQGREDLMTGEDAMEQSRRYLEGLGRNDLLGSENVLREDEDVLNANARRDLMTGEGNLVQDDYNLLNALNGLVAQSNTQQQVAMQGRQAALQYLQWANRPGQGIFSRFVMPLVGAAAGAISPIRIPGTSA